MKKITIQFRKIFSADSTKTWENGLWNDSFLEYKMKAQFYDEKVEFPDFKQLLQAKPDAEKLHYLTSLGCMGAMQQLNNLMPDVVDTLNKRCLPFVNYRFQILNTNFNQKEKHRVQIDFFSEPLYLIEAFGDTLWLGLVQAEQDENMVTFMVKMQPNLMIINILK